jgi:hypothetical protein
MTIHYLHLDWSTTQRSLVALLISPIYEAPKPANPIDLPSFAATSCYNSLWDHHSRLNLPTSLPQNLARKWLPFVGDTRHPVLIPLIGKLRIRCTTLGQPPPLESGRCLKRPSSLSSITLHENNSQRRPGVTRHSNPSSIPSILTTDMPPLSISIISSLSKPSSQIHIASELNFPLLD